MSTSPLPLVNVWSASRALLSCTATFLNSRSRYAVASPSDLPCWSCEPYAAITFHFAPPEVNGLGVTTSTPCLVRSSQVLMFLGLPLRTAKTTTEVETKPSYFDLFQFSSTRPLSTSFLTSGASEKATTSAGNPPCTARLCSPDPP